MFQKKASSTTKNEDKSADLVKVCCNYYRVLGTFFITRMKLMLLQKSLPPPREVKGKQSK